jgi:hypothetical protein
MRDDIEDQHRWARDIDDNPVHISKARSGKQGYFCGGCKREMVAVVNFKNVAHQPYFRHDVVLVLGEKRCTFSEESYRHKVAKEILQRLGEIKVPPVYCFPSNKNLGSPNLIHPERMIRANAIQVETCFYEDETGALRFGPQSQAQERKLLIRPDVIFFDKQNKPVLFIELVATHGIDQEKHLKLRRLAIDTVQVKIPTGSLEEIEHCFKVTERTKWEYNYEQENTRYIRISRSSSEAIQSADEIQGRLFEETFSCRTAEITNLVHAIGKCLVSEPYKRIEQEFREEISGVESITEIERDNRIRIQERVQQSEDLKFAGKEEELDRQEEDLIEEENRFNEEEADLERRYFIKRESIIRRDHDLTRDLRPKIEDAATAGFHIEKRREQLQEETRSIEADIERNRFALEELLDRIGHFPEKNRKDEVGYANYLSELEARERSEIKDIEKQISDLPARFEQLRSEIEAAFEAQAIDSARRIKERDGAGDTELARNIKNLLDKGRLLFNYQSSQRDAARSRKAYECFREGAYKNWNI